MSSDLPCRNTSEGANHLLRRHLLLALLLAVSLLVAPTGSAAAPTLGPQQVAVLLVSSADSSSPPATPQDIQDLVFTGPQSANTYYQELSYGQISFEGRLQQDGDVFGWYTLDAPSAPTCDRDALGALAENLAGDEGVSLAEYDHVIYILNWAPECRGVAISYGPASRKIYIGGNFSITDTPTYIHELGHNFDLWHAGSIRCTDELGEPVPISDNCTRENYGDIFDPMGSGKYQPFSNWRREQLGILTDSNVRIASSSGAYSFRTALNQTAGITSLRVPRTSDEDGNVTQWYGLETREEGSVFDSWFQRRSDQYRTAFDNSHSGIAVRLESNQGRLDITPTLSVDFPVTALLDANPQTNTFADAFVQVGETLVLDTASISVLSVKGGVASVYVDIDPPFGDIQPASPSALQALAVESEVELTWEPDADGTEVDHYGISRDGTLIDTSFSTSFTDENPPAGEHTYTVYAYSELGIRGEPSEPAVVTVPDFESPNAVQTVFTYVAGADVTLGWWPVTDNLGVTRYVVFRDGEEVGDTPAIVYDDADVPAGEHTYVVYAEDAAGNRSGPSEAVALTMTAEGPMQPGKGDGGSPVPKAGSGVLPEDGPPANTAEAADVRGPRLRLSGHRRRHGVLVFQVRARDGSGVALITLRIDGRLVAARGNSSLLAVWRSRRGNRSCRRLHRVVALARDHSGNRARRAIHVKTAQPRGIRRRCRAGKARRAARE